MRANVKAAIIHYYYGGGVAPALLSGTVSQGTATTLDMTFSGSTTITTDGWSIDTDGPNALSISSVSGSGTSTPSFTLSREILPGESITLSYDAETGSTKVGSADLESITNQAVTNSVLWWAEDFVGTTIDTDRFTVTNPDSENLLISQNNELRFTRVTDVNISNAITNNVQTNPLFTRGVFSVFIDNVTGFSNSTKVFRYWVDSNNFISIQGSPENIRVAIQVGGSTLEYDVTSAIPIDGIRVRFQFNSDNEITFEYWDGSLWKVLPSTSLQVQNPGDTGKIHISSNSNSSDSQNDVGAFHQLRYAIEPWGAELPEGDVTMGNEKILWGNEFITF